MDRPSIKRSYRWSRSHVARFTASFAIATPVCKTLAKPQWSVQKGPRPWHCSPSQHLIANHHWGAARAQFVKKLCSRIHLVIVFGARKAGKLIDIFLEPGGTLAQEHATVLKICCLGIETHQLVVSRRREVGTHPGTFMLELLNQL